MHMSSFHCIYVYFIMTRISYEIIFTQTTEWLEIERLKTTSETFCFSSNPTQSSFLMSLHIWVLSHPAHLDNILAWTAEGSWEPAVTAGGSQVPPPLTRSPKPDQWANTLLPNRSHCPVANPSACTHSAEWNVSYKSANPLPWNAYWDRLKGESRRSWL